MDFAFSVELDKKDSLPRRARSEPNVEGAQWVPGVRTFQKERKEEQCLCGRIMQGTQACLE